MVASNTELAGLWLKSDETSGSVLYSRMPLRSPSAACLTAAFTSSTVVFFLATNVRSTSETLIVGTRIEKPSSLPLRCGKTRPTAAAAPVLLARRRDDHLLRARLDMRARLGFAREEARALHHHIDAQLPPRQLGRIAFGDDLDAVAVHHEAVAVHLDGARELAMGGVVFQEMGVRRGVAEVVDGDELQALLLATLVMGAQHHAPNTAESIDRNLDRHLSTLLTASATRAGVKPKCLNNSAAGADSPKRSMPTTAPSRPTYLRQ